MLTQTNRTTSPVDNMSSSQPEERETQSRFVQAPLPQSFPTTFGDRVKALQQRGHSFVMNLIVELDGQIELPRLRRALRQCLDAESIFHCRFDSAWWQPVWRRRQDIDVESQCWVRPAADPGAAAEQWLLREHPFPNVPLVEIGIFRGAADVICLRMDHVVADVAGLKEFASLLCSVYRQLSDQGEEPLAVRHGRRGFLQIYERLPVKDRRRLLARFFGIGRPRRTAAARWQLPPGHTGRGQHRAFTLRLDASRVARLFDLALECEATVNQVIMAGIYRAAVNVFRTLPAEAPRPIRMNVDLRRHLSSKVRPGPCNLYTTETVAFPAELDGTVTAVAKFLGKELRARRQGLFGMTSLIFNLESLPVIRHVVRLLPFAVLARFVGNRVGHGICFSDAGQIDASQVDFGAPRTRNAYGVGAWCHQPGFLNVNATSYQQAWTLNSCVRDDCIAADQVAAFYHEIDLQLP